jgi:hypothetical protein
MSARQKSKLDSEQLTSRLKVRSQGAETKLLQKHPEAKKFYENLSLRPGRIRDHAAKLLTSGALAGTLLLSPAAPLIATPLVSQNSQQTQNEDVPGQMRLQVRQTLEKVLPEVGQWKLDSAQEKQISEVMENTFGIKAVADLEGNRLNNSYGRMGAEQHLPRYPGDSVDQHDELVEKGITPGLGAWGYFAYSKDQMTQELYDDEKWYVAVQTLYLPNWNTDTKRLAQWYKYRRVVVVNPKNGKTLIADVADAGPAAFTGKHFGGSPEVMKYLGIDHGMQNHPVVLFFLDDPKKEIPLGPLEYNVKKHREKMENRS